MIYTLNSISAPHILPKIKADIMAMLEKGSVAVDVKQAQNTRSAKQNRLLWLWHGIVGKETGETTDEVHDRIKESIVLPFMLSHPDRYEHAAQIEAMFSLRPKAKILLVRLISTTDLSVKHMAEFLTRYERETAVKVGIVLPRPEDLYYDAMGKRR